MTTSCQNIQSQENERRFKPKQGGEAMLADSARNLMRMWPTPSAALHNDAEQPETFEARRAQAVNWPTPAATDSIGARNATSFRSNPDSRHHSGVTLTDAIHLYSPQAQETPTHGEESSPIIRASRRQLNPEFVEWLMGWPPGWTSFGCSETGLCLYRRRMRSALSSIGLPRPAPPEQVSLFG